MSRPEILTWDCREQPDLDKLARVVLELSHSGEVHLTPVDDTGCDESALIVADRPYGQPEATETFLRHWRGQDA